MSQNYTTTTSVYEAAIQFANNLAAQINQAAADVAGVDVMWFRLMPDKRNQDVIFQTYTLYGVDDCPLSIKAVYSDTGYDDAAITYNILGLEYAVPLTLEIPVNTWYEATNHDGTLPQRGDIVFIPASEKLLEVVSMTPVKAIMAQTTSFKMNCSIYKPTRSRIVGEDLKESIEENTVNLKSRFGEDIDNTFKDIVDDNQSSIFTSTTQDKHKSITITSNPVENSSIRKVYNIVSENLTVDGHDVARSYYDMNISKDEVVVYKDSSDVIDSDSTRCLSMWVRLNGEPKSKNIKSMSATVSGNKVRIEITGKPEAVSIGDDIVISRGSVIFCGKTVSTSPFIVEITKTKFSELNEMSKNWMSLPGFTATKTIRTSLMSADGENAMDVYAVGDSAVCVSIDEDETFIPFSAKAGYGIWLGIVINIAKRASVDVYSSSNMKRIAFARDVKIKGWGDLSFDRYFIRSSTANITNIRVYKTDNTDIDRQITDLVSYNARNNSLCVVNDSADVFLDKSYIGQQR